MNEHKEVVGFEKSSWPAEKSLWVVSIALGTLIAAAESVFGSTTALLVGISLAMNPFCFQAKARNARLFGATKSDNQAPLVHVSLWPESKSPIGLDTKIEKRIDGLLKRMTVGKRSVMSSSPNGSRSARRRWHNIISARLKTAAVRCPAAISIRAFRTGST